MPCCLAVAIVAGKRVDLEFAHHIPGERAETTQFWRKTA